MQTEPQKQPEMDKATRKIDLTTVSRRCQPSSRGGLLGEQAKMDCPGCRTENGPLANSAIDPRNPLKPRAQILDLAQNQGFATRKWGFQK